MQAGILKLSSKIYAGQLGQYIFPVCLLTIAAFTLTDYLQSLSTVLIAGYAAIASNISKRAVNKKRYATVSIIFLLLTCLIPVKTLLYLSLAFMFFFWLENNGANVHSLSIAALLLSSPAFHFTASVFSFPIRLQLTKLVGSLFSFFETNIQLKGNIIIYKGSEFAVDPACMGLHMLSISMLLGILLIGLLQKKAGKTIGWKASALFLLSLFLLNIVANVFRIILLVQFAIPPEAFMHDVTGLLCLLLYVIIPACFLAKFFVTKAKPVSNREIKAFKEIKSIKLQWFLLAGLLLVAVRVIKVDTYSRFENHYQQSAAGFSISVYAPGIVKLQNEKSLIYIKYIRGFYDTEHNPAFCWQGSGYKFKNIQKKIIEGKDAYTAILSKGNQKLYTAWWYGNENFSTTSQWEWRWNMIKTNATYALLNVTASSEELLKAEIKNIKQKQLLEPFFKAN